MKIKPEDEGRFDDDIPRTKEGWEIVTDYSELFNVKFDFGTLVQYTLLQTIRASLAGNTKSFINGVSMLDYILCPYHKPQTQKIWDKKMLDLEKKWDSIPESKKPELADDFKMRRALIQFRMLQYLISELGLGPEKAVFQ